MTGIGAMRFNPAVSVMQSMVARIEQPRGQDTSSATALPNAMQPQTAETAEASDDFYFGTRMTVTKLMFFMMEKVVSHLNDKLDVGADGGKAAEEAGNRWRKDALKDTIKVGSAGDFRLPEPGENGVTFREVAKLIESKFNMGFLSRDSDFTRMLEGLIGFRLPFINMADIVEAFTEPDGNAAKKLRGAIEDGLAGQEGSKVSQRLERAADGAQSVPELAAMKHSAADVVDEETQKEDREALETARMQERLGGIRDMLDGIGEAVKAHGADGNADPADARATIDGALAIIRHLTGAEPEDVGDAVPVEADTNRAVTGEDAEASLAVLEEDLAEADDHRHAALADAYSDRPDPGEEDRDEPGFRFTI